MPRYALILAIMGFRLAVKKLKMVQIIKYDGMMLEIISIALAFHRKHPTMSRQTVLGEKRTVRFN